MDKIDIIAAGIEVAMKKGLTADQCYKILKDANYTDADLHLAFLKAAANYEVNPHDDVLRSQ